MHQQTGDTRTATGRTLADGQPSLHAVTVPITHDDADILIRLAESLTRLVLPCGDRPPQHLDDGELR